MSILSEFPRDPRLSEVVETVTRYPGRLCYCNYHHCQSNNYTCLAKPDAACFHFIEYAKDLWGSWTANGSRHQFGCLPPEEGGSAMQCHGHLPTHDTPKTIACCFDEPLCNLHLQPPPANIPDNTNWMTSTYGVALLTIGSILTVIALLITLLCYLRVCRRRKAGKRWPELVRKLASKKADFYDEHSDMDSGKVPLTMECSGSGSQQAALVRRTMRQDISIKKTIGQGRYGEVLVGEYKGDLIAVKVSSVLEEISWKNENDIYQHLSHEHVLRWRNADIGSLDSVTQMYLYTDYHELGSLYDYLNRDRPLSTLEACQLLQSAASGLAYLHLEEHGKKTKPAIAHRDIKTKNLLVKAPGVCCIADFGLAVKACVDEKFRAPNESPEKRVGTKRYMAPEVLEQTMRGGFSAYPRADMYAFGLVMWEVTRRVEEVGWSSAEELRPLPPHNPILHDSLSSGIGSSLGSSGPLRLPHHHMHHQLRDEGISSGDSASDGSNHLSPPSLLGVSVGPAKEYLCPFGDVAPNDPSFEHMREIVVLQKHRPEIEPSWRQIVPLDVVVGLMESCWSENPEARKTSLRVKKDLSEKILPLIARPQPRHSPLPPALTQVREEPRVTSLLA